MKHDCLLNVSVGVLAGSIVPNELPIEVVEMELDLSTTREFSFPWLATACLISSLVVELACDCVLVDCHEISDHVPEEVHLLSGLTREGRAEIS